MDIYDGDKILDYRKRIRDYIKAQAITEDFSNRTFGQVIEILKAGKSGTALNPINPTAGQRAFIDSHSDLYTVAINYNFVEFSKIYVDSDQLVDDKKQAEDEEGRKGSKRDNLINTCIKFRIILRFIPIGNLTNLFAPPTSGRKLSASKVSAL